MIEYLKDPLLVVKVQNFFGIVYKRINNKDNTRVLHSDIPEKYEDLEIKQHKRFPSDVSGSSQTSCDTETSTESGLDELELMIGNKFWYYLFVIGTELGDEIFYATFIPFWFWNVDGAVGRRVVLVWTIVMYIGKYLLINIKYKLKLKISTFVKHFLCATIVNIRAILIN